VTRCGVVIGPYILQTACDQLVTFLQGLLRTTGKFLERTGSPGLKLNSHVAARNFFGGCVYMWCGTKVGLIVHVLGRGEYESLLVANLEQLMWEDDDENHGNHSLVFFVLNWYLVNECAPQNDCQAPC
jgi:hypothetical protein